MNATRRPSGTGACTTRSGKPSPSSCLSGTTCTDLQHTGHVLCGLLPPRAFLMLKLLRLLSMSGPLCSPVLHFLSGQPSLTQPSCGRSVGVQGDQRTHSHVVALREVTSADGMTADWYQFEPAFLSAVSTRICNTVKSVNRVVYDITSKPPGTIEWE